MPSNIVEDFYSNYNDLLNLLEAKEELSLYVWFHENFNKIFVIVIANYFENEIKVTLKYFAQTKSRSPLIASFLEKSMERQFHTYFDWDKKNANKFFSLFGEDFRRTAINDVNSNGDLDDGIKAFIEIVDTRNMLSHEKLLESDLTKTAEDFYKLYKKALVFIEYVKNKLEMS